MTRRALLSMLAAAVADPERLLWQPGRKLISIPPARTGVTIAVRMPVGPPIYPEPGVLRLHFNRHAFAIIVPRIDLPWEQNG